MEFETKIITLVMISFLFTLILFGICFYMIFQQYGNNQIRDQNYETLFGMVKDQINVSMELTNKIDSYLSTTSLQMDTLRTEDNLNFFKLWLLAIPKKDRDFIEDQSRNVNLTCLSSIDSINMNPDIFTMWLTVSIKDMKESRSMRFSRSAVTCHYFTMTIPCEELCIKQTGEVE